MVGLLVSGVIENADLDKCLAPASYLLRVGSYLESSNKPPVELQSGEAVVIQPQSLLLIGSCERVHFPANMVGFLYLRSSYARRGLLPWSQGLVEPGYSGGITIVLHNHSNDYIPIVGDQRICHLTFQTTEFATDSPYKDVYQHSRSATPAQSGELGVLKIAGEAAAVVGRGLGAGVREFLNF